MDIEDLAQNVLATYRYLDPHQQLARQHQIAETESQTFNLTSLAIEKSKGLFNGAKKRPPGKPAK